MYILVPLDITFIQSVFQIVYQFSICLIHNVGKVNQYFLHLTQKKGDILTISPFLFGILSYCLII